MPNGKTWNMKLSFREEQSFRRSWIWFILVPITLLPSYGLVTFNTDMFPFNDMPFNELIIFLSSTMALSILFLILKLKTEITEEEIRIQYFPFTSKTVKWVDVKNAKVLNYGFVGGWGIRLWTEFGTVYNTSGSIGLAIEMNDGKKFLIGTHKENELRSYIKQLTKLKPS